MQAQDRSYAQLAPGDPLPQFAQRGGGLASFRPDTMAGRYLVFCLFGSAASEGGRRALDAVARHRDRFDDQRASLFGVSADPADERDGRVKDALPGIRQLWDFDTSVHRLLGALPREDGAVVPDRPRWVVVDPSLHVMAVVPFEADGGDGERVLDLLDSLPHPRRFAGFEVPAPVLVLPQVFDPGLCRHLIGLYDADGGGESGVMRNNVGVHDRSFKSRKDYSLSDNKLITHVQGLMVRRVLPEIEKLFFMKITRMERYMVGCYSAEDGGHFRPHRDNNSEITAHRRFAVSINLNADFEGGEVSFPEYNERGIKAPPGWAVVFPCAALHMVSRVTRGRRYAFLPFVYDEAGAAIRQRYLASVAPAAAEAAPAAAE